MGGSYQIAANLRGNSCGCGGVGSTVGVHVAINSTEVASDSIMGYGDTFSYTTTISLAASDTLDILIDEGINNLVCDHIAVDLVIRQAPVGVPTVSEGV